MRLPARVLLVVGIVLASLVLGVLSGTLMVRYVFPSPPLFLDGKREGTPVQIVAFLATFFPVAVAATIVGIRLIAAGRRGSPKPEG